MEIDPGSPDGPERITGSVDGGVGAIEDAVAITDDGVGGRRHSAITRVPKRSTVTARKSVVRFIDSMLTRSL